MFCLLSCQACLGCFFETHVDVGFLQRQNSLSKASKKSYERTTRFWNLAAHHVIFSQLAVDMCAMHLYLYARSILIASITWKFVILSRAFSWRGTLTRLSARVTCGRQSVCPSGRTSTSGWLSTVNSRSSISVLNLPCKEIQKLILCLHNKIINKRHAWLLLCILVHQRFRLI